MSTTVDQRVVQMQFDNAQFEKGVQETLNSLNRLNNTVENTGKKHTGLMAGLAAELGFVAVKAKGISDNVGQLNDRFSILGTFGGRIVENMTDSLYKMAVNCGKTLTGINSMTSGFDKFGQKTRAVATLMTATGASMEEVNKTLDDLQWFTDETSYNFTDMIDTMSKLSASGTKDLGKLLRMTEGFAMAGAKAGANAQLVSRGMFQISQAASRGYIQYQDWMQALGTTNIATADLKQRMIEAAGATAIEAGAYEDFNGSLRKGWLTFDVFSKVMDDFTQGVNKANYANGEFINSCDGAADSTTAFSEEAFRCAQECRAWEDVVDAVKDALATGWSKSFEYILGDANEVRGLFTGIANVAIAISEHFSEARNEILGTWKALGGRDTLLQGFINIYNAIYSYVEPIKEAFMEVFGIISGESLNDATNGFEGFTRSLILTRDKMIDLKITALNFFSMVKKGYDMIAPYTKQLLGLSLLKTSLLSIGGILGGGLGLGTVFSLIKMISAFKLGTRLLGINVNLSAIAKTILGLILNIRKIGSSIKTYIPFNKVKDGIYGLIGLIDKLVTSGLNGVAQLKRGVSTNDIFSFFKNGASNILSLFSGVFNFITNGVHNISNIKFEPNFNPITKGLDMVSDGAIRVFTGFSKLLGLLIKGLSAVNPFNELSKTMENLNTNFEVTRDRIKNINGAAQGTYTILDAFRDFLSYLNYLLAIAIEAVGTVIQGVLIVFKSLVDYLSKVDWSKLLGVVAIALYIKYVYMLTGGINGIASSINNMFGALTKLKPAAIGVLSSIKKYFNTLTRANYYSSFLKIALGIGLITASLYALSYIPDDKLTKMVGLLLGLTVIIGGVVVGLAAVTKNLNPVNVAAMSVTIAVFSGAILSLVSSFTILTAAITVLVKVTGSVDSACEILAVSFMTVMGTIGTLIAGITLLAITFALVGKVDKLIGKGALSILKMAAAVSLLASGLLMFHVACLLLTPVLAGMAASMLGVVKAIGEFYNKIEQQLGKETAMKALVGLALTIASTVVGIVVVVNKVVSQFQKLSMKLSKSVLVFSGSILILAAAIWVFSHGGQEMMQGALTMGMVLTTIAMFFGILNAVHIDKYAEQMKQIGTGMAGLGAGILLISKAISAFGKLDLPTLGKGLLGVGATIAALVIAIHYMDDANIGKVTLGLLSLVGALYLLTPIIALFGTLAEQMVGGALIVSGFIYAMAASIKQLNEVKVANVVPTVAALIGVMLSLTLVLDILNKLIKDDHMNDTFIAFLAGMITLGVAIAAINSITSKLDKTQIVSFGVAVGTLSVAVLAMSAAMTIIAQIPANELNTVAFTLNASMIVFAGAIYILAQAADVMKGADVLELVVLIGTFAVSLSILSAAIGAFAGDKMWIIIGIITAFTVAIGVLIGVCGTIGVTASPALTALAGVLLSIAGVMLAAGVAVHYIYEAITKLVEVIINGIPAINNIITTFGVTITSILSGVSGVINSLSTAFNTALVSLSMFIVTISTLDAGNILKMGGAIIVLGGGLLVLGAGATVGGAGLVVLAAGVTAIGAGITILGAGIDVAANAVLKFRVAIGLADDTATQAANKSGTWGYDLAHNYASGLAKGNGEIAKAAMATAQTIARPLHQSVADFGPLADTDKWGAHLIDNIMNGMKGKVSELSTTCNDMGQVIKDGIMNGSDGAGDDTVSNVLGELSSKAGAFFSNGSAGGTNWGNGFISAAGGIIKTWTIGVSAKIKELQATLNNNVLANEKKLQAQKDLQAQIKKEAKEDLNLFNPLKGGAITDLGARIKADKLAKERGTTVKSVEVDTSGFLQFDDFAARMQKQTEGLTDSLAGLGDAAGKGGGKSGGGGGGKSASDGLKDAEEAAKKAAERLKELNKFTQNSIKTNVQYNTGWGLLLNTLGTLSPIQAAKDSINALAETIYQATLTGDEAALNAEERAAAVAKAFNEAFDNIKTSVKNSMNLFEEFDFHLERTMDGKTLLKNAESQLTGYVQLANSYKDLALKGFDQDIIAKVIEGGASELPKIKSMLKMTSKEVKDFNRAWADQDGIATFVASSGMAARAMATNIKNLRANAEEQRKNQVTAAELFAEYDKAVASGNLDKIAQSESAVNQKAQELNMTVDQLRAISQNTGATADEILIKMIDKWENAKGTVLKYNEVLKETKDKLQEIYESQLSFIELWNGPDAFTIKDGEDERDVEFADIIENVEKQNEATKHFDDAIAKLGVRFEKFGGKGQMILGQLQSLGINGLKRVEVFLDASQEELDKYFDEIEEAGSAVATAASNGATAIANLAIGGQEIYNKAYAELQNGLGAALANAGDPNGSIVQTAAATGQTIQEVLAQRISRETGYTTTEIYNSGLIDGFVAKLGELTNQATVTGESADQAIAQKINEANGCTHTTNFMMGMLKGIQDNKEKVLKELDELAKAMADLAAEAWDEHSPSKLTYKQARYFIDGMTNSFRDHGNEPVEVVDGVVHSITDVMQNALSTANAILNDEVDFNPVITPVLDLSSVQNGSKTLSNLFNTDGFRMEANVGHVVTPAERMQSLQSAITPTATQKSGGNTFNYVQNNYSPKALSRLDIYRDTKNQFAQLKGLVTNNG